MIEKLNQPHVPTQEDLRIQSEQIRDMAGHVGGILIAQQMKTEGGLEAFGGVTKVAEKGILNPTEVTSFVRTDSDGNPVESEVVVHGRAAGERVPYLKDTISTKSGYKGNNRSVITEVRSPLGDRSTPSTQEVEVRPASGEYDHPGVFVELKASRSGKSVRLGANESNAGSREAKAAIRTANALLRKADQRASGELAEYGDPKMPRNLTPEQVKAQKRNRKNIEKAKKQVVKQMKKDGRL